MALLVFTVVWDIVFMTLMSEGMPLPLDNVEFWISQGVTSFKGYNFLTRAELGAAIEAAHARKIKVTAHLCSIGFREAAQLGIGNLSGGLTQLQLNRILQALGLGNTPPPTG